MLDEYVLLVLGDNEFLGEVSRVEGMQKELSTRCPDCKVTVQDTQVGNLGVKLGQLAQTLLRRDPDVNFVLPTYDAQAIYVVPAIKAANFDRSIEVVGSDAVPSNLDWIRQSNIQVADVGEPETWLGWAALDEVARGMLGLKPVDDKFPCGCSLPTISKTSRTMRMKCSAATSSLNTSSSGV